MKKIAIVFVICLILIGGTFLVLNNPDLMENTIGKVGGLLENIVGSSEEEYSSSFKINELGIKQNTYYYDRLSDEQKNIYTSIANGVKELQTQIKLKEYTYNDMDTTMKDVETTLHKFLLDHPEVFYLEDKYTITTPGGIMQSKVVVNISYSVANKEELDSQIATITQNAKAMFEEAKITAGKTFDNELAIHDVVANRVKYFEYKDTSEIPRECHTIYGAFIGNAAVCDGLSKAIQILLNMADMESILVTGNLNNEAHAWNMVNIEDEWYHLDVTSNKSVKKESGSVTTHAYFNIPTEKIQNTHSIDEKEVIPQATQVKYNYFQYLNKTITTQDNYGTKLASIIDANKNGQLLEFQVNAITDVPDKTIEVLRKGKYTNYLEASSTKFVYYNILDVYIIFAK